MLVLGRRATEWIQIGDAKVTVVRVRGNRVTLGIEAPKSVHVLRGEVTDKERHYAQDGKNAA
jgi:carbon storage regulator